MVKFGQCTMEKGHLEVERRERMNCVKHYFCMFNVVLLLVGDGGLMQVTKRLNG